MNDEKDDHIFVYKRMHFEPFYVANHIHHMQRHTHIRNNSFSSSRTEHSAPL